MYFIPLARFKFASDIKQTLATVVSWIVYGIKIKLNVQKIFSKRFQLMKAPFVMC